MILTADRAVDQGTVVVCQAWEASETWVLRQLAAEVAEVRRALMCLVSLTSPVLQTAQCQVIYCSSTGRVRYTNKYEQVEVDERVRGPGSEPDNQQQACYPV